ncbi:hypothetical protein PPROV_000987400 [Pycnococcus provasolii]|uniref:Uncharacterized protein n=1 Tax=Pycnococcus provasolii TaxID=41880 RepID=A0A830HVA3_9CHLO|nr:hypothetical protein PPROV_000987400 [Pycnococcus provasolii]|mmetsp:Transcript_4724/g.12284  ORF Transcript_4724/g.12284 Transcript_4724/m.12284 type:complete len:288 (-) Transcript_4724:96-959(-)
MASPQALSSIASSVLFGGPPSAPPPPSAPASSSSSGTLQGGGLVGSSSTQQQSNQALGSLSSSGYVGAAHHVPTHRSYAHNSSRIRRHIDDTLGRGGDLAEACRLPPGEDVREWVAAHAVDFFSAITAVYQSLDGEFCTCDACPTMSAGLRFEYRWRDDPVDSDRRNKPKAIALSAPEYVAKLSAWIEAQLDNASLFPQGPGEPFGDRFDDVSRLIFKRLFRVLAHIYHAHFHHVATLGVAAHLNTCFKHFVIFAMEFDLVDSKDMLPLQELVERVVRRDAAATASS